MKPLDNTNKVLTEVEALAAMHLFLKVQWERWPDMPVVQVLSDTGTYVRKDGSTNDLAAAHDWRECVEHVLKTGAEQVLTSGGKV